MPHVRGHGGSSRDEPIVFTTPNMEGMPYMERLRRGVAEGQKALAAKNRQRNFKDKEREAAQAGDYKYASLMSMKADKQLKKSQQLSFRRAKYLGNI
tara:strand:- start:43 stop:333 length:291 start_codon:yes stop_codon:yes gene_type:complete